MYFKDSDNNPLLIFSVNEKLGMKNNSRSFSTLNVADCPWFNKMPTIMHACIYSLEWHMNPKIINFVQSITKVTKSAQTSVTSEH